MCVARPASRATIGDRFERRERPDRAAAEIGRVLDDDQPLPRRVRPIGPDRGAELVGA